MSFTWIEISNNGRGARKVETLPANCGPGHRTLSSGNNILNYSISKIFIEFLYARNRCDSDAEGVCSVLDLSVIHA